MPDSLQRLLALLLGIATAPFVGALSVAIRIDSPGSALYVATRMGEHGKPFGLLKLRTMHADADRVGPGISTSRDPRITRMGRLLRQTRLDELPQLWNVVRGELRLVGPRPEDPRYVDPSNPVHRVVFWSRPGITGVSQLLHADEARGLVGADPETRYRELVLPTKVALDAAYLAARSTSLDLWILVQTIMVVAGHGPSDAAVRRRIGLPVDTARREDAADTLATSLTSGNGATGEDRATPGVERRGEPARRPG